jgi:hypothetical protein
MDFEPSWEWDCDAIQKTVETLPDGTKVENEFKLGPPPRWIKERMDKKGIKIKNLK